MTKEQQEYYKIKDDIKMYYFDNKLIGDEFTTKKYLIAHFHIAPTKAKKRLLKIKEWIENK
jgi:hypothetical protein